MTTVEKAFADLLAAQEYYKIKRFAEISPLLKQYKIDFIRLKFLNYVYSWKLLSRLERGDPLGPALQYMAIKKCRNYGFSRLENRLLDYLQLQQKEIRRTV